MKWGAWENPDVGQIYEVKRKVGETLECTRRDQHYTFRFEATDVQTYNVFKEVRYVRAATPGGLATPVRLADGGWEIWSDGEKV